MKHITTEQFDKIKKAAEALADLETGCRNQEEKREQTKKKLCYEFCRECQKLPKEYKILSTHRINLGTKKWSHCIESIEVNSVDKDTSVRETEKSIIVENSGYKRIISKNNIICYVW